MEKGKKMDKNLKRKVIPLKIKDLANAAAAKKAKTENVKTPKKPNAKKQVQAQLEHQPMDTTGSQNAVQAASGLSGDQSSQGEEKSFDSSSITEKKKTRETPIFNDKNLDYNLFNNDPDNVVSKKIKISSNVIVQCRMIDGNDKGKSGLFHDYAALSFLRKTKDEKAFEFNLPLGLATNIIEALKLIIQDNPKFFQKYKD
jgi:hypothetical protein